MQLTSLLAILFSLQALLNLAHCGSAAEESGPDDEEDFSPEQLARARDSLAKLYDEKLDVDKDGKVTRRELTSWLTEANRQLAERDLDEAWRAYNLTAEPGAAEPRLDWETHAARRAAGWDSAEGGEDQLKAQQQAELHAEVKRAIEEASKETGIDKAGIKVGMPELPKQKPAGDKESAKLESNDKEQHQQRLAVELGRDRRRWEAADADGDGRLSRKEFAAFAMAEGTAPYSTPSPAMRRVLALEALERMDSDADGRVSLAEFLAGAPPTQSTSVPESASTATASEEDTKNFRDVWDVDKDDQLDAKEMEKMLDYLEESAAKDKDGAANDEADLEAAEEADRLMAAADKDKDGSLTRAEVLDALREFTGSAATDYGGSVGIHDEL